MKDTILIDDLYFYEYCLYEYLREIKIKATGFILESDIDSDLINFLSEKIPYITFCSIIYMAGEDFEMSLTEQNLILKFNKHINPLNVSEKNMDKKVTVIRQHFKLIQGKPNLIDLFNYLISMKTEK